jgi:hypothetical protein
MFIRMQHFHDVQIAAQPENGGNEHIEWLFNNLLPINSDRCFHKQIGCNDPDNSDINKRSQGLQFLISKREINSGFLTTHKNSV